MTAVGTPHIAPASARTATSHGVIASTDECISLLGNVLKIMSSDIQDVSRSGRLRLLITDHKLHYFLVDLNQSSCVANSDCGRCLERTDCLSRINFIVALN